MKASYILVTGGAGYIGKHIVLSCLQQGYHCLIIDNLLTSAEFSLDIFNSLVEISERQILRHYQIDIRDKQELEKIFLKYQNKISLIIHLAALKSIPESILKPDLYYQVNVEGTQNLIDLTVKYNIKKFVFSSTAAVYAGLPPKEGYQESDAKSVDELQHAYGKTKRKSEILLETTANSNDNSVTFITLRYFNPIGNVISGEIGENLYNNSSTALMSQLGRTALGFNSEFNIYGNDYQDTPDGTAMRDFIDVNDLANAHLDIITSVTIPGYYCYNIGTGIPTSVNKLVNCFAYYASKENFLFTIKYQKRREGDQPICFANTEKVKNKIVCNTSLEKSCQSFINRCKSITNKGKFIRDN